ncbi:BnaA02g05740D [Brassica napus]|uniref:BnaA02g05740D protein n=1 Tax=Brassica napus TaxID=3708 RepID=A0A078F3G7_BRANA|nr:BnaA03g18940D [Brassica napus]CDY09148.1 BnaA02g05740D [Brassica napus]
MLNRNQSSREEDEHKRIWKL